MSFTIEFDREEDGRWIAALPGVLGYGLTQLDAEKRVEALAARVMEDHRNG